MIRQLLIYVALLPLFVFSQENCSNETYFEGEGTYYFIEDFGNFGNCSIENEVFSPFLIGAMNAAQYGQAEYCSACVEIEGPIGSVKVHIIDQCPECAFGDIDLSPEAFDYLAPRIDGRINIRWKIVPCETQGNVQIYIKEKSNQWWTGIQIRNHRNPLEKVEYLKGNTYYPLTREDYNYYIKEDGDAPHPITIRITDIYGNQIVEEGIPFIMNTPIEGENQFPVCPITTVKDKTEKINIKQKGNSFQFGETVQKITIYDLQGREKLNSVNTDFITLTIEQGNYILKVETTDYTSTKLIYLN